VASCVKDLRGHSVLYRHRISAGTLIMSSFLRLLEWGISLLKGLYDHVQIQDMTNLGQIFSTYVTTRIDTNVPVLN
jgi:hypothetical protein